MEKKGAERKCTEVLFFIKDNIRLEYISVQGRLLLIYCYFMTMIVSSFFIFVIGKKICALCLFYVVPIMLL